MLSCVRLFVTPWIVACQAPLSMGSRQEYWSWLPCPSPGELPHPEVEHASSVSFALQADSSSAESSGKALKRFVLPEPRKDPSKRMHSVRPHSTGAAHGAASGREGRGAGKSGRCLLQQHRPLTGSHRPGGCKYDKDVSRS